MDDKDEGLERLCRAYFDLNDDDREKVVKLGEGLLKSQKAMDGENDISERKYGD